VLLGHGAEADLKDDGAAVFRRVGDSDGLLVDAETNVESFARLFHR
jgi:hypothetical protein